MDIQFIEAMQVGRSGGGDASCLFYMRVQVEVERWQLAHGAAVCCVGRGQPGLGYNPVISWISRSTYFLGPRFLGFVHSTDDDEEDVGPLWWAERWFSGCVRTETQPEQFQGSGPLVFLYTSHMSCRKYTQGGRRCNKKKMDP